MYVRVYVRVVLSHVHDVCVCGVCMRACVCVSVWLSVNGVWRRSALQGVCVCVQARGNWYASVCVCVRTLLHRRDFVGEVLQKLRKEHQRPPRLLVQTRAGFER